MGENEATECSKVRLYHVTGLEVACTYTNIVVRTYAFLPHFYV